MKKTLFTFLLITVFAILTACGTNSANTANDKTTGAQPANNSASESAPAAKEEVVAVKHQLGEAKVIKNPKKVVVFDFGVLDSLDRLGVEVTALPKDGIPTYLAKYKDDKYVNAGTLFEPDFEKIYALKPDLIIISGRAAKAYEELNKIAPTVQMAIDTQKYSESFAENMKTLGRIFGKEKEVEAELATIDKSIQTLKNQAFASGKKALIVLTTGGKVSAYGPGSRFGLIHDVFGIAPVDENIQVSTHGMSVTFEYIAEKNPDYLFVIDRDAVVSGSSSNPAKQVIENDLVKKTKAFKENHIAYLDANYWYLSGGGLASMSEMIKEVQNGLK